MSFRPSIFGGSSPKSRSSPTNSRAMETETSIPRPSLLAGLNMSTAPDDESAVSLAPPRPRRLWKVADTKLRSYPPFYPPPNPRCCCKVEGTAPSVIAVRISECLLLRSVSVEYDEEAATATAMTVDHCQFIVHLWQAHRGKTVIVECIKTTGNSMTFHRTVYAVLQAARSLDSGRDRRTWYQAMPSEYPRFDRENRSDKSPLPAKSASLLSTSVLESLERSLQLLRKDRLAPQLLGMESLVCLTDSNSVGVNTSMYAALAILGAPITTDPDDDTLRYSEINQQWIIRLLVERKLPRDERATGTTQDGFSFSSCASSILGEDPSERLERLAAMSTSPKPGSDNLHGSKMRSLALRTLTNALQLLHEKQPKILKSVLTSQASQVISPELLDALIEDLQGASRPPSVLNGTLLASQHEAACACRCLGILGSYNEAAKQHITTEDTLGLLEKARYIGRSNHTILGEEAQIAYCNLTEDVRSC